MNRFKWFDWKIAILAALMTAMIFSMRHMSEESKDDSEIRRVEK